MASAAPNQPAPSPNPGVIRNTLILVPRLDRPDYDRGSLLAHFYDIPQLTLKDKMWLLFLLRSPLSKKKQLHLTMDKA
jgi:hypothetical protein